MSPVIQPALRPLRAGKFVSLGMHPADCRQDSAVYYGGLVESPGEAEGVEKPLKSVCDAESGAARERFMKVYGSNRQCFDNLANGWIDENAEPPAR